MKKGKILALIMLLVMTVSCTGIFSGNDNGIPWLNGRTFTGEVNTKVTGKEDRKVGWAIVFDQNGHLLPEPGVKVEKENSYTLKDNVLEVSWIIIYEENNARCTKDIRIEKLPDMRISYREKQTIIGTDEVLERDGILFERMR